MDELFKKTNEFLLEFYAILKELEEKEIESLKPIADPETYGFPEVDYIFEKLWEKESHEYLFGAGHQYQSTRNHEFKELTDKGIYFRFCKYKVYEKTYKERLNKFLEIYEDAEEINFLEDELEAYSEPIGLKEPFKYLDLNQKKELSYTRNKTVKFLVQQAKIIGYNIIVSGDKLDSAIRYVKEEIKSKSPLLKSNSPINETKPPKYFDYLKIGVLIAQGKLTMIKGGKFQYQGKNFNKQDIKKQLESDLNINSVRQYIEGTFGADADSTLSHDFFRNETKIKKTVEYCLFNKIQITKEYQIRFDKLE